MKKYLPSLIVGTLLGLAFLLLGLVGLFLFIGSLNAIFLLWAILCALAVFYILWAMRKRKLDIDQENKEGKSEEVSEKKEADDDGSGVDSDDKEEENEKF